MCRRPYVICTYAGILSVNFIESKVQAPCSQSMHKPYKVVKKSLEPNTSYQPLLFFIS